jgi:tight adherence protein C
MTLYLILGGILVLALLLYLLFGGKRSSQSLEERLEEMAALGQPITLEELELSQPLSERILKPMFQKLTEMAQKMTPQHTMKAMEQKLRVAGLLYKISPAQFFTIRIISLVIGGALGIVFAATSATSTGQTRLMMMGGGLLLGYLLPDLYVSNRTKKRQAEVLKALPDALDLLTICVEAGLGFDAAMSKVADKWDNELSLAFRRAVQEMQLGKLRREALRDMAESLDVADVTSFVAAIVQADQLGVSMAKVMRIQSEQMRMKRRQRAEEKARQAPVKIMIPLVFFIFPTIFIILLGPAVLQVKDVGF